VVQLHQQRDRFEAAGIALVVIGNGAPHFMAGFREHTGYAGPLYTDPSLEVYKAAELKRGVTRVINPRALLPTIKAFARGGKQGSVQGDAWQQGGVLVVAPGGEVRWHHASDRPGDNATVDRILAAVG
jgi:hypothetical protein